MGISIEKIEEEGMKAVEKLRLEKLNKGLPFMINSSELPVEQCYLEYSTGIIKLAQMSANKTDFIILKEFSQKESSTIRHMFLNH